MLQMWGGFYPRRHSLVQPEIREFVYLKNYLEFPRFLYRAAPIHPDIIYMPDDHSRFWSLHLFEILCDTLHIYPTTTLTFTILTFIKWKMERQYIYYTKLHRIRYVLFSKYLLRISFISYFFRNITHNK